MPVAIIPLFYEKKAKTREMLILTMPSIYLILLLVRKRIHKILGYKKKESPKPRRLFILFT